MPKFLELSVSLRDVLPRPLRRFRVRAQATFGDLHEAIMAATGWGGGHLWTFIVEGRMGDVPIAPEVDGEPLEIGGFPAPDAYRMRLTRHLGLTGVTACRYLYDFGDGWECDVLVHDELTLSAERRQRVLIDAEFAWPPDDCGGPFGFAGLQEAVRTGKDPEGLVAWARETFGWTGTLDRDAVRRGFDR